MAHLNRLVIIAFCVAASVSILGARQSGGSGYDPMIVTSQPPAEPVDLVVRDSARRRDVPVLVYLPRGQAAAPVVLFSHGLGGARTGSAFLGRHWAARGYVAVFL